MKTKSDLYDFSPRKVVFTNMQAMEELLLIRYLSFSPCDKLFRREIFLNIRFPEKKECEDLPALYDAVKNSRNVVNIGKIKYFYCYRENSMSRRSFSVKTPELCLICTGYSERYYRELSKSEKRGGGYVY